MTETQVKTDPAQVHALVVGIETYQLGTDYDLDGPAKDGLRFIDWLRSHDVPPENIRFFVSPLAQNSDVILQARQQGTQTDFATRSAIDTYIRNELITEDMSGEVLYVFWGGHGILTKTHSATRRLLFADTTAKDDLNLNLDSLVQALGTAKHGSGFDRQVFLIDACANSYFQELWEIIGSEAAGHSYTAKNGQRKAEQFVLFAAGEYEVAINSFFSEAVLAELQAQPLWSDMKALAERVQASLKSQGKPEPTYLWIKDLGSELVCKQMQQARQLQTAVGQSSFSAVKKRALERRLRLLTDQYEALSEQFDHCIDAGVKVILNSKISGLDKKLNLLETEIGQMG